MSEPAATVDQDGLKPAKVPKESLYKPPTNEEMKNLRESELLFHSNLMKLQIHEMLREITLSSDQRNSIISILSELRQIILNIKIKASHELHNFKNNLENIKIPFNCGPPKVNGVFSFAPPSNINVVGSYSIDIGITNLLNIDLLLIMPKSCLQEKDFLNQRYLRKRAMYLAYVAEAISKNGNYDLEFSYFNEEPLKPVLLVKPKKKNVLSLSIILHVAPDEFKSFNVETKRFLPSKSNIRKEWFCNNQKKITDTDQDSMNPTPHCNSVIMSDILMEYHLSYLQETCEKFDGLKEAIRLLKVWLHQRGFDQGYGPFSGFLVSMILSYLIQINKIRQGMNNFQIIRLFFNYMVQSDFAKNGISFHDDEDQIKDFQKHFSLVFIGPSGNINLFYSLSEETYEQVKNEARISLNAFEKKQYGFDPVFMKSVSFVEKYDFIIHLPKTNLFQKVCKHRKLEEEVLDFGGNCISVALTAIISTLKKALNTRIKEYGIKYHNYQNWNIQRPAPFWNQTTNFISIGFCFDSAEYDRVLEKGPEANQPEAAEFRQFWGDLSEIRRFKDTSILEAVYWDCTTSMDKRNVVTQICQYVLKRHCGIPPSGLVFPSSLLDQSLMLNFQSMSDFSKLGYEGTGDELNKEVVNSCNDLCQLIRSLNLPLSITNIQGISSVLRYTEVFVPSVIHTKGKLKMTEVGGIKVQIPFPSLPCPSYMQPIEIVCDMEGNSQWPDDVDAIQRIKAAFHITIAEELKRFKKLLCLPSPGHVDILKNGFVFRIIVAYHREAVLMKTQKSPEGLLRFRDTKESNLLEYKTQYLPLLTSHLHGLQQKYETFGRSCRLAKKWLNFHMFSNQITEETADLLMAYVYTNNCPFLPPQSSTTAFLRFLKLLASFNFAEEPVIVDFNNQLKDADIDSIQNHFKENRSVLPQMCIFTQSERIKSWSTFVKPSRVVIRRLRELAEDAISTLEGILMSEKSLEEDLNVKDDSIITSEVI